jgi:hypothetical protein
MNCGKLKKLLVLLCLVLVSWGCRLHDKEWDINAVVPIAHGDLTLSNLVNDSSIRINPDKSLTFVNTQTLKALSISDLLKVPDTSFTKTVSLKQIDLGTRILKRDITLGEVAKNAGFAGAIIAANNGKKMVVPAVSNLSTGQTNINAQSFFQTATFVDGNLELDIRNGFPIELTDMHFQLLNKGNNAVIIDDTIVSILPNHTHSKTYSLAGKTVDGNLIANILSMNSPGSKGDSVLIDTTNALTITIIGSNMHVFSATAIFPAQNVVNDMLDINYNLQGPVFKSFIIRAGKIEFKTRSTIKENMFLYYSIPGARKGGDSIAINMVIPPAGNDTSTIVKDYPLDGYNVDLTGQHHDTVNTFYNILRVHIDSTGKMESLSLADSIYIHYALLGIVPEYAKGYLGKKTYSITSSVGFDLFKNLKYNSITLPKANVNLQIANGVGAPAQAKILSLVAMNSKTSKSVQLTSSKYVNTPISIPPATDGANRPIPSIVTLSLNDTNSNINSLLSIIPDQFFYTIEFTIDPNGNTSNYNDFIYYESSLTANLNMEMPLEVGFDGLILEDTLTPDFGTLDLTRVQAATLHLTTINDYPFEAKVQLYILDKNNKITDSLINTTANNVPAGNGDPFNPIPGKGIVNINISQSQWQALIKQNRLILKSTLRTANSKVVKIYSNNHLKATLTGDFKYRNLVK